MTEKKTNYAGVYKDDQTGKYAYRFRSGKNELTGKTNQRHKRGFPTAKAAAAARAAAQKEAQSCAKNSFAVMTFQQFTNKIFIPDYYSRVNQRLNDNQNYIFSEFISWFGNKKLKDITIFEISDYKKYLLEKHHKNGAQKKFRILHRLFKTAKKYGLIDDLLTEKVGNIPSEKVAIHFWTKAEFYQVISQLDLANYREHFAFTLLWLYYMTGLRANEATSLWWSENIDFDKKQIRVFNNLDYRSQRIWQRKTKLKTESSRRIISIDETTIRVLASWKKRQVKNEFVLSYKGYPLSKKTIRDLIIKYATRANVKIIQPKGLRHSHASLLINEYNVTPLLIQKRLGHSRIETTLNVYSHLYPNADREMVQQLNGLFPAILLP